LVQQEELQIGQLAAEVIKLRKEAEVARLEALALDKELQISLLLGRLDLGPLEGQDSPLLEETFREALNQPKRHHLQHNNKPKHHRLPQQWYKDFCKDHQQVNHKGNPKDHQQAHLDHQGDRQRGHQGGNHLQRLRDRQQAHLACQEGCLQGNHRQRHHKWGQHPMEAMEL
jgi:hypothetical protein